MIPFIRYIAKFVGKKVVTHYLAAMLPITVVITVVSVVVGIASIYVFGPNNTVEKIAEKAIQKETGIEVDFSPSKEAAKAVAKPSKKQLASQAK